MPKLLRVVPSATREKKYDAVFRLAEGGAADAREKVVSFGGRRENGVPYDDYLNSGNRMKREAYIARHRVNEDWTDPMSAGTLSRYLLWGDSRKMSENLRAYRRRFGV
jgi:hypothetical protein